MLSFSDNYELVGVPFTTVYENVNAGGAVFASATMNLVDTQGNPVDANYISAFITGQAGNFGWAIVTFPQIAADAEVDIYTGVGIQKNAAACGFGITGHRFGNMPDSIILPDAKTASQVRFYVFPPAADPVDICITYGVVKPKNLLRAGMHLRTGV